MPSRCDGGHIGQRALDLRAVSARLVQRVGQRRRAIELGIHGKGRGAHRARQTGAKPARARSK